MKEINSKLWETPKHRKKLSEQFDLNCYKVASAFMALQAREINLLQQSPAGSIGQNTFLQMATSLKKIQELGKVSFGEIIESTQMKLDLRVVYDKE